MKATPARAAAAAALALALLGGLGSRAPAPQAAGGAAAGIDYARGGNYKVRAFKNGANMGIGLYDAGSFRLLPEGRTVVSIHDRESGESWLYDRVTNEVEGVARERAATFDNFMPASCLEPYFALTRHWSGGGFEMVTDDGRTFRIRMDGPESLPTLFEVSDRQGAFQRMEWAYFKVGEVSERNFSPPGDAAPKGR